MSVEDLKQVRAFLVARRREAAEAAINYMSPKSDNFISGEVGRLVAAQAQIEAIDRAIEDERFNQSAAPE